MDRATAYESARQRISGLVRPDDAEVDVPACPGWTVKDVVAHLAGSLGAYASGAMQDAGSPEWGEQQVKERTDASLDECFAEWERNAADTGDLFDQTLGAVALADVLAHEQDIRGALERPGAREEPEIVDAIGLGLSFLGQKIDGAELPALRVVTEDLDSVAGSGEPAATVRTTTFELFRAIHGRRSPAQIRALGWEGDSERYAELLPIFGPRDTDLRE
jgi:uncharacterized protein (TIGR03083 family)